MSSHRNADGSVSDGIKDEAPGIFIAHDIGVACTTSAQLPGATAAQTAGATTCSFQNDGQSTAMLRYRLDGTVPTASAGVTLGVGQSILLSINDAINVRFIQAAATATINASYSM
jgi:hypothetical protein